MVCCVDWIAVDWLSQTTGCCCLNSRKIWKVSICEASFSGHSMVIQHRCLHFCSCLQINLYCVVVRVHIRLSISLFAYLKLAEFGIERHILSTVDSLSEELLMPVVLQINSVIRVLLEKLIGPLLVKKFPELFGTRRFITVFTKTRQLSLSFTRSVRTYIHSAS